MKTKTVETITFRLYIAGFNSQIEQLAQKFCSDNGLCVFVNEGKYLYMHGFEHGSEILLINYARFPKDYEQLHDLAIKLAHYLLENTSQKSCSVVGEQQTHWITIDTYQ